MKLTYAQKQMLKRVPTEWAEMPAGVGCTNATMTALEKRGLIETRIQPGQRTLLFAKWDWRLTGTGFTEQSA